MTAARVWALGLLGCEGRMGKRVSALLASEFSARARLTASVDKGGPLESLFDCDVVIDFSTPEAAATLAARMISKADGAKGGPALVVASTGWQPDQRKVLEEAAQHAPILTSANFSLGVLAFMEILKAAAPLLDSLGYKPVLIEGHHEHKKDAPSGTALALQRIWKQASASEIETHSIRAGEIVGDHQISFYGPSDLIRIEHSAFDRDIFARGAIAAALWLAGRHAQDPSWHGMVPVESFFSDLKHRQASV